MREARETVPPPARHGANQRSGTSTPVPAGALRSADAGLMRLQPRAHHHGLRKASEVHLILPSDWLGVGPPQPESGALPRPRRLRSPVLAPAQGFRPFSPTRPPVTSAET